MLSRLKKKFSSETFSHFFHFFIVFTGIFLVMTIIILQIMRYGLYSSVDSSLRNAAKESDTYVNVAVEHSSSIQLDGSNVTFTFSPDKKPEDKSTGVQTVLYNSDGEVLNTVETYTQLGNVSLDSEHTGAIVERSLVNSFGQEIKYRSVTVAINDDDNPDVAYATFLVSVRQLDEASDRYVAITISVMVVFWIISVAASIYLAKWSRKPILESYEKQKSFVENASHELRTPLAVLQNRLESLFRKPDATILDSSESIAASLDEVRNMRLLTTNLLNLARRDDGLTVEMTDISPSVFDDIFENYEMIAEENEKTFIGHNAVTRSIKSDKTLLKQLMTILFDNAIKYTDDDGQVEVTVKTTEKQFILTVADNGQGISDADKTKIFDRFYRVDKARTRQQGGFGLGLSLAQQIVQALKGTITVKNNTPNGTIFEVKFEKV